MNMNIVEKARIQDALSRVEEHDSLYSIELFSKLQGNEKYLDLLIEYGVFKPEMLASKYVYAMDYFASIISSSFIDRKKDFIISFLISSFKSLTCLKSYSGYFVSKLWDIFLLMLPYLDEGEFSTIKPILNNPDYLIYKLKDHKEIINDSKFSLELIIFIFKNVKLKRILLEEAKFGTVFKKEDILSAINIVLLDNRQDFKYLMYKSSLTLREYDEGSILILLASKILIKYNLYTRFIAGLSKKVIIDNLHLCKLIFRIELQEESLIGQARDLFMDEKLMSDIISSGYFKEEVSVYITKNVLPRDYLIKIVSNIYSNSEDKYQLRIKNAYIELLENNKTITEVKNILSPIINVSAGFTDLYKDTKNVNLIDEMTSEEINEYYIERNENHYFSSNSFREVFIKQLVESSTKFLDMLPDFNHLVLNDVFEVLCTNKDSFKLPAKYFSIILDSVAKHIKDIQLYNFHKFLDIYNEYLNDSNTSTLIKEITNNIGDCYSKDVHFLRNEETDLSNISNRYINTKLESYIKIINLINNSGVENIYPNQKLVELYKSDIKDNINSFLIGANILYLYASLPQETENLYLEITDETKIWFLEGYIMNFNLRYTNSDIIRNYILHDINNAYKLDFKNDITITNLGQYYTVIFANGIYDLDFNNIMCHEEYIDSMLFTYQNTPRDANLKNDLSDLIKSMAYSDNIYTVGTFERLLYSVEHYYANDKEDAEFIDITEETLRYINIIAKNKIGTFSSGHLGYQFFNFLRTIDHFAHKSTLVDFLDNVLTKKINCDYLPEYVRYVSKTYNEVITESILEVVKNNKSMNHWYSTVIKSI